MMRRGFIGALITLFATPFVARALPEAPLMEVVSEGGAAFHLGKLRDYGNLRDLWMFTPRDASWQPRDWTVKVETDTGLRYIECRSIAPGGLILVDSIAVKRERLIDVQASS